MRRLIRYLIICLLIMLILNQVIIAYKEIDNIEEGDRYLEKAENENYINKITTYTKLANSYYLREIAIQLQKLNQDR